MSRLEALLKAFPGTALPIPAQAPSLLPTQSTMRTLPTFNFCCRSLAVMATELKKQNPLRGVGRKRGQGGQLE